MLTKINLIVDFTFFNRCKQNRDTPKHWNVCGHCRRLGVCSSPFCGPKCFPFMAKMQGRTKTANRKCVIASINLEPRIVRFFGQRLGRLHQTVFFGS